MPPDTHRKPLLSTGESALLLALIAEIIFFASAAPSFASFGNFFEVLRFSVELGLLAVALTPILITGGIDLSVGSTIGLTAVLFGVMTQAMHLPMLVAVLLSLLLGIAAGALNAALIAGLRLPALIVTLGTFSLYRGIAEGITHGAVSFTGYPAGFLHFGQGYFWKLVPVQLPIFLLVVIAYGVLLHRSVIGRSLYAIGFNAEGARYAGLPVRRRLALIYVLSGVVASLAAIIYVAHLGLAKSDLGTGYELQAIAAVVLGGTSVFGGRGTIFGSMLGLFFLSVLQNGMHLMALPSELYGVLTGLLLLLIVSADRLRTSAATKPDELTVTTSRRPIYAIVAVLAVAGVIFALLHRGHAGGSGGKQLTIAVMPKAKGDPYFISARAGAEEAAKELHINLIWDGPTSLDASQQNELVENWITRGVNAIVVAVENKGSISTVLRKARAHGIPVMTWDADAQTDARDYFLNQATPEGIGTSLADEAARLMPQGGQYAIVTGALSAENQNDWIRNIKARVAAAHPNLTLATIQPSDDDRDKAFNATQTILKAYPQVKMIIAISAPAVPGAAEAVTQSGRTGVDVIGLSLPSICRAYIHAGSVQTIFLWNTRDLGYLTVYAGALKAQGKIAPGATSVHVGRLGDLKVRGSEIVLGVPLKIDRSNVDQLKF
ncbi:ABC transporter permease/substrate-binding protein [Terriglobus roseus]|uniref:Autoinducer 2 import system permease protein LsrD n=1 Tax=Terriglobus roseus TaxID=392734 RepID=A0A1H4M6U2_9BACT|nr:substrate-binding domain-containing protein [Terriglobus roseus]SEB78474.1 monosaccharide ABC transporter substrate-binding protein, CUT2 family /monosaccharide ABC transporter membrane protein, CUT2 family [Terriglobus roseus]